MEIKEGQILKTLYLTIIVFVVGFGIANSIAFADNTNNVNIADIHTQPSSIKVGDMFKITATLENNSPDPISVVIDDCEGPFAVTFDNHVMVQNNNFTCAYSLFHQTLNSNETTIKTSPGTTLVYKAVDTGATNATVTFTYYTKNQTDPIQSEIRQTISKSFQFDILDNNTNAIPPSVNHSYPVTLGQSPLKQFKSGIPATKVVCKQGFQLIIKAEDGSPACVKSEDVTKLVSQRMWGLPINWFYLIIATGTRPSYHSWLNICLSTDE